MEGGRRIVQAGSRPVAQDWMVCKGYCQYLWGEGGGGGGGVHLTFTFPYCNVAYTHCGPELGDTMQFEVL